MISAATGKAAVDKHDSTFCKVDHRRFTVAWIALARGKQDVALHVPITGTGDSGGEKQGQDGGEFHGQSDYQIVMRCSSRACLFDGAVAMDSDPRGGVRRLQSQ